MKTAFARSSCALLLFAFASVAGMLAGTAPTAAGNCGGINQRACNVWERIPSCDRGLVEHAGACRAKVRPGIDCGPVDKRACNVWERIPSCNQGLVEHAGVCRASGRPGIDCGPLNKRPCKVWERIPSCNATLEENIATGACAPSGQGANARRLAENALKEYTMFIEAGVRAGLCMSALGLPTKIAQLMRAKSTERAGYVMLNGHCLDETFNVAKRYGYQSLTVGFGGGGQFVFGANSEIGVGFDLHNRYKPVGFSSTGILAGVGAHIGNDIIVSGYKSDLNGLAGKLHGFTYSGKLVAGGGVAVWLDYGTASDIAGISVSAGAGVGGEVGTYNLVNTVLMDRVYPADNNRPQPAPAPAPTPGHAPGIPEGTTISLYNERSGRCLDVAENRDGGKVVIADCGSHGVKWFQAWRIAGSQIVNIRSGLCLDVAENRNGGKVVIASCGDRRARPFQHWINGHGSDQYVNRQSNRCLDVAENRDAGRVVIDSCGNGGARPFQIWRSNGAWRHGRGGGHGGPRHSPAPAAPHSGPKYLFMVPG